MPIDHDTLLRILLEERAKVLAFIRLLVRRQDLAEDIFQDLCVLALQKREEIQDAGHLAGWLRTAARFRAMKALENPHHRQHGLSDAVLERMEENWKQRDSAPAGDLSEALRVCMGGLSEKGRELLLARYADGRSVEQIAQEKNRPVKSVYVSFSRIHAALSDCVFRRLAAAKRGLSHA